MGASLKPATATRITGVTTEQLIGNGQPVVLLGIYPDAATTGTLTLRNGAGGAVRSIVGTGLPLVGVSYDAYGIEFSSGLSVQPSSALDAVMVVWMPTL